jgi:hypothetical protein
MPKRHQMDLHILFIIINSFKRHIWSINIYLKQKKTSTLISGYIKYNFFFFFFLPQLNSHASDARADGVDAHGGFCDFAGRVGGVGGHVGDMK